MKQTEQQEINEQKMTEMHLPDQPACRPDGVADQSASWQSVLLAWHSTLARIVYGNRRKFQQNSSHHFCYVKSASALARTSEPCNQAAVDAAVKATVNQSASLSRVLEQIT